MTTLIDTLTASQKSSNFTLSCIDQVNTSLKAEIANLDSETHVDDVNDVWVSSTSSTTYAPAGTFYLSVGTNNQINETTNTNLGSNNDVLRAQTVINVGHGSDVMGTATHLTSNVINVGHGSDILNPADLSPMESVINIGNGNDINNGSYVVAIGHNLNHGGQITDTVIISGNPLDSTGAHFPADGSIILQSSASTVGQQGGRPPTLPRVCFFGDELVNPRGQNVGDALDGTVTFALPNINGYLRMKYKGVPILVPFIVDSDSAANVGNPTNITEF